MTSRRPGRAATALLALAVPLVALVTVVVTLQVTSDTGTTVAGPPAADAITIENFRFAPNPLVVSAGATVTVTNADGTAHTVTASDGTFDTGDLDGGASATFTITKPGTYTFFCNIHNYMTGTIEVR